MPRRASSWHCGHSPCSKGQMIMAEAGAPTESRVSELIKEALCTEHLKCAKHVLGPHGEEHPMSRLTVTCPISAPISSDLARARAALEEPIQSLGGPLKTEGVLQDVASLRKFPASWSLNFPIREHQPAEPICSPLPGCSE